MSSTNAVSESQQRRPFTVSQRFGAPRETLFAAWTERERLLRWWGPKGFTMVKSTLDLRPGRLFHYHMRAPNGHDMFGKWVFRDITAPERLVFTSSFSDDAAATVRAPFSPDWPLEVLTTVTFTPDGGGTLMEMSGIPINAAPQEFDIFEKWFPSMQQGWAGTLEQLAAEVEG